MIMDDEQYFSSKLFRSIISFVNLHPKTNVSFWKSAGRAYGNLENTCTNSYISYWNMGVPVEMPNEALQLQAGTNITNEK